MPDDKGVHDTYPDQPTQYSQRANKTKREKPVPEMKRRNPAGEATTQAEVDAIKEGLMKMAAEVGDANPE